MAFDTIHLPPPDRRIFSNRTLNLRSIQAVGFDMDYTLIHYRPEEWELRAYEHLRARLVARGWPVEHLHFDARLVSLGLIMDLHLGNLVKANRFGYVKAASHGTHMLPFDTLRERYAQELIDLHDERWVFINTLFGLSEACMFSQVVELLDAGDLASIIGPATNYEDLYRAIKSCLDEAHMEGELKADVVAAPERYVDVDKDLPLALLDLKRSGKTMLLITNSEWPYTQAMMSYAFDPYLPDGLTWRDLFDLVVVRAMKPGFFTGRAPFLEVVDPEREHLRVVGEKLERGEVFVNGNAAAVERFLGLSGEQILYVGDHIYADVHVSKSLLRWRTALVVRSLEREIAALQAFAPKQRRLNALMDDKALLEHRYSAMRLALQRKEQGYGPQVPESVDDLRGMMQTTRDALLVLDADIAPLAQEAAVLVHSRWGPLMRAGNDKSHLARQLERSADVYTSRVSNLLPQTPFVYLRSARGSLPHDASVTPPPAPDVLA